MNSLRAASFALSLSCLTKSAISFAPTTPAGCIAFSRINDKHYRTIRPMAFADSNWDDKKSQYEEIFRDDFDGDSIDTTVWNQEIGFGPGNGEVQYYTDLKENAYVEDGVLHVKALRDREYNGKKYDWTSARLNTKGNFNFSFGRMSARIRCEPVAGPFSAVWALSEKDTELGWPLCGEIDFFEMQTLWDYTPSTLHFQEHHYGHALSYFSYETFKTVNEWHVFGVEWSDTHLAFYHDGKRIGEYPRPINGVSEENWPYHWQNPFYLIINNAMNPEWGTKADDDLMEHDMEVDWIVVEKKRFTLTVAHAAV